MNDRKRNHNCHCFGTVCHDNTTDVRDVLVPSKAGGPDAVVRMSAEGRARHAEGLVKRDHEAVRAHVALVVAAFGRACDA